MQSNPLSRDISHRRESQGWQMKPYNFESRSGSKDGDGCSVGDSNLKGESLSKVYSDFNSKQDTTYQAFMNKLNSKKGRKSQGLKERNTDHPFYSQLKMISVENSHKKPNCSFQSNKSSTKKLKDQNYLRQNKSQKLINMMITSKMTSGIKESLNVMSNQDFSLSSIRQESHQTHQTKAKIFD